MEANLQEDQESDLPEEEEGAEVKLQFQDGANIGKKPEVHPTFANLLELKDSESGELPYPTVIPVLPPLLGFYRLNPEAILPTKGTSKSACYDLYALEDAVVRVGTITKVLTGWRMVIPAGYRVDLRPRSGLAAKHGITVVNSPGTIDEDYPGEAMVLLTKVTFGEGGSTGSNSIYYIKKGDRVAQIKLERVVEMEVEEVQELPATGDRTGGCGSTGK